LEAISEREKDPTIYLEIQPERALRDKSRKVQTEQNADGLIADKAPVF
jgi:hypothetical protein